MKAKVLVLAVVFVFALASFALAVTASKTLTFDKSSMGKVTFSGKTHSKFKCAECHNPEMFAKKQQGATPIKMADIYKGNLCGKCHNGTVAFKAMGSCSKCHVK